MSGIFYHFHAKVGGRSGGKSAVAAAAYRAGDDLEITSERALMLAQKVSEEEGKETRVRQDYTRRDGVVHSEILAPDSAQDWVRNRQELWNKVEDSEKRKDAQLFRELTLGLPHNMDEETHKDLVRDFVKDIFVSEGMVADIAIHKPARHNDERNVHAHVMLTMRELDGDSFSSKKNREWNNKELVDVWRKKWEEHLNAAAEKLDLAERADCRSYKDRAKEDGVPALVPTRYKGAKTAALLRKGFDTAVTEYNERVREYNMEGALERVVARKSAFTVDDLKEELLRSGLQAYIYTKLRVDLGKAPEDKKLQREVDRFVKNYCKHIREESGVVQLRNAQGRFTPYYTTEQVRNQEERLVARASKLMDKNAGSLDIVGLEGDIHEVVQHVKEGGIFKALDVAVDRQDEVASLLEDTLGAAENMAVIEDNGGVASFLEALKEKSAEDAPKIIVVKKASELSGIQDQKLFSVVAKSGAKLVYLGDSSKAAKATRSGLFRHYLKAATELGVADKFETALNVAEEVKSQAGRAIAAFASLDFRKVSTPKKQAIDAKENFDKVSDRRKKRRPSQSAFSRNLWKECKAKYMQGVKPRGRKM
jgi:hypothetical protein